MIKRVIRNFAQCTDEIRSKFGIHAPLGPFATANSAASTTTTTPTSANTPTNATASLFLSLSEAFIQRQIMPDRILPASRRFAEKWEMLQDPVVDVLDSELFERMRFNGHEDQAREGVRRLRVDVNHRIVRNVRRMWEGAGRMLVVIVARGIVVVVVKAIADCLAAGWSERFVKSGQDVGAG